MTFSHGVINDYISAMNYGFVSLLLYKNIRVWRLWAPGGRGPVCLAHSAHPIATPLGLSARVHPECQKLKTQLDLDGTEHF